MKEAETCVGELNVPHFHHELVKRAVTTALDKGPDDRAAMASLLAYLHAEGVSVTERREGAVRQHSIAINHNSPSAPGRPLTSSSHSLLCLGGE
jgi:hypothetical protein